MKWKSIKDKYPKSDTFVIVYLSDGSIRVSYYFQDSYGKWFSPDWNIWNKWYTNEVTHWMKLPKPPKEEKYDK